MPASFPMTQLEDRPVLSNRVNRTHGFGAIARSEREAGETAPRADAGRAGRRGRNDAELSVRSGAWNAEPIGECAGSVGTGFEGAGVRPAM